MIIRLTAAAAVLLSLCFYCCASENSAEFKFHHDNILGTSLDLTVVAAAKTDADAAERAVVDEVERLRRILSSYDAESELSKLLRAAGATPCSSDLIAVLKSYDKWNERSKGAYNCQVADAIKLWKNAEKSGSPPESAALDALAKELTAKPFKIDAKAGTVTRTGTHSVDLNSLGKGYIIDKAVKAAREKVPGLRGLLLNIGGDICADGANAAGKDAWTIGVANPARPAENAAPLTLLNLRGAVATSGAYERFFTISGKKYSHILDARTCIPAEGVASATVIAADSATANALATTLCILPPQQGLELARSISGAECLIIAADGKQTRSNGFADFEVASGSGTAGPAAKIAAKPSKWPKDFEVSIALSLIAPPGGNKVRSPYVAIWIEDSAGKPIRTVTVWGNKPKYLRDLPDWWKFAGSDNTLVSAVTRATRRAGKYTVVWDGTDDKKEPVEPGEYTVQIEIHREHGARVRQTGKIMCGTAKVSVTLAKNAEADETQVTFGPHTN